MKKFVFVAVVVGLLAGCGNPSGLVSPGGMTASDSEIVAQAVTKLPTLNKVTFAKGLAAGRNKAKSLYQTQDAASDYSYDYGYAVGLIQGALNAYARIDGTFDVGQWKSFAFMNRDAMADALRALQKNPEVAAKQTVAIGILQGGLASFDSIKGSFKAAQWAAFADSNKSVLSTALAALTK
ncbi:MAG TPA: hypothetical protein V6D05_03015 [Stenomitos sp.]